eukprot:1138345-Pelagomonas_calceolata.AAC.6
MHEEQRPACVHACIYACPSHLSNWSCEMEGQLGSGRLQVVASMGRLLRTDRAIKSPPLLVIEAIENLLEEVRCMMFVALLLRAVRRAPTEEMFSWCQDAMST